MKIKLLSVDFQKDFSAEGGADYKPRSSVSFVKEHIIPFCREHGIKMAEIISDYRGPRPGRKEDFSCVPGQWGYESEIPDDLKEKPVWVKCTNSPLWVRKNGGIAGKIPSIPYQDTQAFGRWLEQVVGQPRETTVGLIGLTIDCCVLCTAQELNWRNYKVSVIREGVSTYSGIEEEKERLFSCPLENWAKVVSWDDFKHSLKTNQ